MKVIEWKKIKGFGTYNTYFISNDGQIKNQKDLILKQALDKNGYQRIMLRDKNGKRKLVYIHKLVAQAFIPNNHNYKCINHKDENPSNNNVDNLEWCSIKYNNNYGNRIKKASNSCKKKVKCIETGIIYDSAKDIEIELKINHSHISDCCRGKRKTCGGYSWRFANEQN